jgi:hypothetical protein
MTHLDRRIERLEQRLDPTHGPQLIDITPNLEEDEAPDTSYSVKLTSSLWANAFGHAFSPEDIRQLRREYGQRR